MHAPLQTIASALAQVRTRLALMVVANITGMLLSFPILFIVAIAASAQKSLGLLSLGVTILLGILPSPTAAGLHYVAGELAQGEHVFVADQWEGLRRYGPLAFKTWLVSLIITSIGFLNVVFYARFNFPLSRVLEIIWIYLLVTWLVAHLYVFPLLMEQEIKSLLLIYRNAFQIMFTRPGFTFVVAVVWLVTLYVGSSTGLVMVIALSIGVAIQQNALQRVLATFDLRAAPAKTAHKR